MNRIIVWGAAFTVIAAGLFFLSLKSLSWKPYICNTQMSSDIATNNNDRVQFNVNINVVAFHRDYSEVIVIGSLNVKNENYSVYRRVFFTHKPANINGYSITVITNEKRHPKDNVPDTLWQNYILPEVPGIPFYVKRSKLRKNLILYKGFINPIFTCTISK